tara:strand:- start:6 stop:203 length:198 start_codon:yes stop_codon:yes gene_type:complete
MDAAMTKVIAQTIPRVGFRIILTYTKTGLPSQYSEDNQLRQGLLIVNFVFHGQNYPFVQMGQSSL